MRGDPQRIRHDEHAAPGGAPADGPFVIMAAPPAQTVWWVIAVLLAIIATALVLRWDDAAMNRAFGQTVGGPQAGTKGIYAFTGQLTARTFGVFMMDVDTGTIWCYELDRAEHGPLQLRLVAGRSWIFDRYLEEYNVADPVPGAVREMIRHQRTDRAAGDVAPAPAGVPDPAKDAPPLIDVAENKTQGGQ